ncbi:cysteine-rich receptor-like protein kinase 8 [Tanacetum coccineum]
MSEPTPLTLFQNPLYLHPSDGPSLLTVQEKLIGAQIYRAWKRAIEIGLSTKCKLGFVKRTVVRSPTDANLGELWDTCNNMVISWIMRSVSESIARSIMFIGTTTEIWQQLERMFSVSDGSRKYRLNKDTYTYEITQSGSSIGDYFTKMKCVWEEFDSLNTLPVIVRITPEITAFLTALSKQKEEQRLFQFLNGLEDRYSHQRSQILMMNPLPNVESACSLIQQEESQRMLFGSSSSVETTALYSKGNVKDKCGICGFKWHPPEKCWEKVRYPPWHSKFKGSQVKQTKNGQGQNKNQFGSRTASHVESGNISIACLNGQIDLLELLEDWIYDTGASDHMTLVKLDNVILLKDVLVVPSFKFSLLSMPKLTEDSQCVVSFYPKFCVVQDLTTRKVKGLGKINDGLYHLVNVPSEKIDSVFTDLVQTALQKFACTVVNKKDSGSYALWHHRLGHVSDSKLKHMNELPVSLSKSCLDRCLSCPMAKFTKLPYDLSDSHRTSIFELIHIDI